ncbi:hypothetical protein D3C78_940910 [compost metagenome]
MQADAEAWIEGALDHALAVHFEDLRGSETAHQCFTHLGWIGTVFRSEQQGFGHGLDVQGHDDLVGHLGGLTVAVATDQGDVLAHGLEQRQGAFEGIGVAADHDAQRRGLGADFTAGYRGVEVLRAFFIDFGGEGFGRGRRDRAHVDHDFARADTSSDAIGAEQYVVNLRGIRHHDDDEFGFLGDFFRVRQSNGASGDQVGRGGVVVRRQEQAVTGFLQVQRHWVAHDAGADKSDFSHEKILLFCAFCRSEPAREKTQRKRVLPE